MSTSQVDDSENLIRPHANYGWVEVHVLTIIVQFRLRVFEISKLFGEASFQSSGGSLSQLGGFILMSQPEESADCWECPWLGMIEKP